MDKKTIIGGVVVALVFVGFLVFNANQQKKYQEQVRKYQEYLASQQPAMPARAATDDGGQHRRIARGRERAGGFRRPVAAAGRHGGGDPRRGGRA